MKEKIKFKIKFSKPIFFVIIVGVLIIGYIVLNYRTFKHENTRNETDHLEEREASISKSYIFNDLENGFTKVSNEKLGYSFEIPSSFKPMFTSRLTAENAEDIQFQSKERYTQNRLASPIITFAPRNDLVFWRVAKDVYSGGKLIKVNEYDAVDFDDERGRDIYLKVGDKVYLFQYSICPECKLSENGNISQEVVISEKESIMHMVESFDQHNN